MSEGQTTVTPADALNKAEAPIEPRRAFVSPGMPALDIGGEKALSFYEFWPTWAMYLPVVVQWLVLAAWHRSLTLPLIANPRLPISGMVGVPKSQLLAQAEGECQRAILPWFLHTATEQPVAEQARVIQAEMASRQFQFPIVCKPDIGCRGSGVKLVHGEQQLRDCLNSYAVGSDMMVQRLASWEPEAGIFYVREPQQTEGRIISLALKYTPYIVGDGRSTLQELIAADPRANQLQHLYHGRHREQLHEVIPYGKPYRLVFSASHCRGAIFKDGSHLITSALSERVNRIMADLPEFYYGRLDIKFSHIDNLMRGDDIEIVEINSASSESLHIWDKDTPFKEAIAALLRQYRLLFTFGAQNRRRGHRTPGISELIKRWRHERKLTQYHPETD